MSTEAVPRRDPDHAFAEISDTLLGDEPLHPVLETLVELAKRALQPDVETSITLVQGDTATTAAFTARVALILDECQYEQGHGPCLDAADAGEKIIVSDMAHETRWPEFATAARDGGVHSSLSVPLPVQPHVKGALNIYAMASTRFDDLTVELAETFADHAAVAIATAQLYETTKALAEQMKRAMESRAAIEQAKGIIMRDRRCSPEEAFEVLVKLSQDSHTKLREVAELLVSQVTTAT